MTRIIAAYADGGVILKNPSPHGGTFAWCHIDETGAKVNDFAGAIFPNEWNMDAITNNLSECYALYSALKYLPDGWSGNVYSDSKITLGRFFWGYKWAGIPAKLRQDCMAQVRRLGTLTPTLLDGHPTKAQLAAGIGKRGAPVSEWNVWCDKACGEQSAAYLKLLNEMSAEG